MSAPAIVLSTFGSTHPAAADARAELANAFRQAFLGSPVHWALGSRRARAALDLPELGELCARLGAEHGQVVVQSCHLVPGQMDEEARAAAAGVTVCWGAPLLNGPADEAALADAILACRRPGVPNLAVVHGNTRNPHHNRIHMALAERLATQDPELVVASLEGEPGLAPVDALAARARAVGGAHLLPLFVFPGPHVLDDCLGDDGIAGRLGVPLTAAPVLAAQPAVVDLLIAHARAALAA
jgi:sirohydrochlorin cobaltochelatase